MRRPDGEDHHYDDPTQLSFLFACCSSLAWLVVWFPAQRQVRDRLDDDVDSQGSSLFFLSFFLSHSPLAYG